LRGLFLLEEGGDLQPVRGGKKTDPIDLMGFPKGKKNGTLKEKFSRGD